METLSLQRFSPKAAEKVIAVLAEEGSLPVDQKLVEELVEGVAVEGKVSPADIGISLLVLSELAGGRPDASLSLDDFRESGGQAGLLTRYLERLLEQLSEAERPEVLRGVLSLVDLEKDQRLAEGRTLAELEESVKPASPPRFAAALRFLASGKARVLEELPGEPVRYRLVHERLIPAIRKLTGVLLAEAERASLELERGYRLWVHDRQPRFLLQSRELAEVIRFEDQIRWGKEEVDKLKFVKLSRRRQLRNRLGVLAATLIACIVVFALIDRANRKEHQSLLATWGLPKDLYGRLGRLEELTLPGTVTRLDWLSRAKRLKKLTVENGMLESLEGLPAGLETLTVGESKISDLSGFPPSLTSLTLGANQIRTFAGLPEGLESLDLDLKDEYVILGSLPQSLTSLRLAMPRGFQTPDFRRLKGLESLALGSSERLEGFPPVARLLVGSGLPEVRRNLLPTGLRSLKLEAPLASSFRDFPPMLRSLSLQGNDVPPLSELPLSIENLELEILFLQPDQGMLEVDGIITPAPEIEVSHLRALRSLAVRIRLPSILRLRRLPANLISLKLSSEWITLSEPLPQGLRELEIQARSVGVGPDEVVTKVFSLNRHYLLPLAPAGLESLSMAWLPPRLPGSLRRLETPELRRRVPLPAGLESLNLSYGKVSDLPKLPDGLKELNLRRTGVRELPGNLQSLTHLDISLTPIDFLGDLPPSLKSLSLSVRQVKTLEGLPEGVTALHFHRLDQ